MSSYRQSAEAAAASTSLFWCGGLWVLAANSSQLTHHSEQAVFWLMLGLAGILVAPWALLPMLERVVLMAILGALLAVTVVGVVVIFAILFLRLANVLNRMDRFVSKLPFAVTSAALYAGAWHGAPMLWQLAHQWSLPYWLTLGLLWLVGALALVILAGICALFGASFLTSLAYTVIWPWYCVFFIILLFSNDDDDDAVSWGW